MTDVGVSTIEPLLVEVSKLSLAPGESLIVRLPEAPTDDPKDRDTRQEAGAYIARWMEEHKIPCLVMVGSFELDVISPAAHT